MRRLLLCLVLIASPVWAIQPDEVLDDPVLEERARDLSAGLRCLVCRNESIDESNAPFARDIRLLVRERLVLGESDDEIILFLTDRYGDYILLSPPARGANLVLWIAGPAMLLIGAGIGIGFIRGRNRGAAFEAEPLSADEQARLEEIIHK